MYALQMVAFGDPTEVVQLVEVPNPPGPGDDEALVAIEYAPINASVLLTIRGRYGVRPSLPAGVGNEGVGRVLALGKAVTHLKVDDRVVIPPACNSWCERVTLPAHDLFALPANADPQQLSMLYINPPTAALLLSECAPLAPGDWVIQNAGNSGVGRWVIAIAKERGVKTVSLVRRPELVKELTAVGADVVLVAGVEGVEGVDGVDGVEGEGLAERVAKATGHAPIKLALDGVAGNTLPSLTSSLSPGGTLVVYAFTSEQPNLANPRDLIFRGVTIRGFWLQSPEIRTSPKLGEAIQAAARLVAAGTVRVPIAAVYPLTAAQEALAHALQGGKVLFQCS